MQVELTKTLYYQQGTSDKVYSLWLVRNPDGRYIVQYAFGRRTGSLKYGFKTLSPKKDRWEALQILEEVQFQKVAEGYRPGKDLPLEVVGSWFATKDDVVQTKEPEFSKLRRVRF